MTLSPQTSSPGTALVTWDSRTRVPPATWTLSFRSVPE